MRIESRHVKQWQISLLQKFQKEANGSLPFLFDRDRILFSPRHRANIDLLFDKVEEYHALASEVA